MARSPLTLAAAASAALPGVGAVTTSTLSTGQSGRYDAALLGLDDGTRVVVRVPTDESAASDLAAEVLALRALTPGARALLPFRVPEVRGEATLGDDRVVVADFLPGYRIEPPHIPSGPGAASSIGAALAAVHALPASVVRAEGLPLRTPADVRRTVETLIERTAATRRLHAALATRWRSAIDDEELWRFESTVILGETGAASFLFEDRGDAPTVVGVLGWHRFGVGDPAVDLHWLAGAPEAIDDVYTAYAETGPRSPDANLRTRARLYAELEFAKWLLHGHEQQRPDIVDDAVALLDALVDGLGSSRSRLDAASAAGVDEAMRLLDEGTPAAALPEEPSTAMQTDAYDPRMMSLFVAKELEHEDAEAPPGLSRPSTVRGDDGPDERQDAGADTAPIDPIDLAGWRSDPGAAESGADGAAAGERSAAPGHDDSDEVREAQRASRAAFQRWARSSSE
ncbi:phosphotransferase [Microbacterium sp. NPDC078428]|uniref:phosphotransferase n=1 Tax=Microbacterium sp. NPDC078428 TaxID=3364190 RepID=UPI0037CA9B8F